MRSISSTLLALVLGSLTFACAGADDGSADGEDAVATEDNLKKPAPVSSPWAHPQPTNPNGSLAESVTTDSVTIAGCTYSAVIHTVTYQRVVGILVTSSGGKKCAIVQAVGGPGYVPVRTYPGPTAFARLTSFGDKLGFVDSGSSGPTGSAQGTMPTLHVSLISSVNGGTLRSTTQSVCAPGPGGSIQPTGAISMTGGTLVTGGTKNASTGLPGDGTCPSTNGSIPTFQLTYSGFATGIGPVPAPAFAP